jgi:hypothetical protein
MWKESVFAPVSATAVERCPKSPIATSSIAASTREALDFCAPLIKDQALVLFDDWNTGNPAAKNPGERKAFEEWLAGWGCFTAGAVRHLSREVRDLHGDAESLTHLLPPTIAAARISRR